MTPSLMKLVHFKYKGTNETDVGGTKIEDFKDIHYTNKYDKDLEVSKFLRKPSVHRILRILYF